MTNLSKALKFFNPTEISEVFFMQVLDIMKIKNDQVKQAASLFLAVLVHL